MNKIENWTLKTISVDRNGKDVTPTDADYLHLFGQEWARTAATVMMDQLGSSAVKSATISKATFDSLVGELINRLMQNLIRDHADNPAIKGMFPAGARTRIELASTLPSWEVVESEIIRDGDGRAKKLRQIKRAVAGE